MSEHARRSLMVIMGLVALGSVVMAVQPDLPLRLLAYLWRSVFANW